MRRVMSLPKLRQFLEMSFVTSSPYSCKPNQRWRRLRNWTGPHYMGPSPYMVQDLESFRMITLDFHQIVNPCACLHRIGRLINIRSVFRSSTDLIYLIRLHCQILHKTSSTSHEILSPKLSKDLKLLLCRTCTLSTHKLRIMVSNLQVFFGIRIVAIVAQAFPVMLS